MRWFAACLLTHAAAVILLPLAWWAPNLTIAAVVLMTAAQPHRWWIWSGGAGLFTLLWTAKAGQPVAGAVAALGFAVWLLSRHWDLSDARVRLALVAGAVILITGWELSLAGRWSTALLGLATGHVAVTLACVPALSRRLPGS